MHHIRKLYFVPVGLPGMGKSTLAKHINISTQKHLNKSAVAARSMPQNSDSPYFNVEKESEKKLRKSFTKVINEKYVIKYPNKRFYPWGKTLLQEGIHLRGCN